MPNPKAGAARISKAEKHSDRHFNGERKGQSPLGKPIHLGPECRSSGLPERLHSAIAMSQKAIARPQTCGRAIPMHQLALMDDQGTKTV